MLRTFEVTITTTLTVKAKDESKAENLVMDLMERALSNMLDCPAVICTTYTMSADNPKARPNTNLKTMLTPELEEWAEEKGIGWVEMVSRRQVVDTIRGERENEDGEEN